MAPDLESGAMVRKGTEVLMVFNSPPPSSPELIWPAIFIVEISNDAVINVMNPYLKPFDISSVLVIKYNTISAKCRHLQHILRHIKYVGMHDLVYKFIKSTDFI